MNRRLASMFLGALSLSCLPNFAEGLGRTYDWIISIETEKLTGYLDQKRSTLKPVVKATVTYKPGGGGGATKFEELFYHNWIALGMRRYKPLALGSSDQVAIVVTHKQGQSTQEETSAAANAIVRVFLDAYLKGNAVTNIIVPEASLSSIVQNLKQANFYPGDDEKPDQPVFSSIILHLEGSPSGTKQTMFYAEQTR
ncbi:MAG TPA: hypothetical protein EYN91_15485 [Candidatus Melainabacteria bacterium]|jgi:hypothetical protein|nr:hypothetical protein [Candidatus Melainabacteria bacterium]HIN65154.1 hypothetical protein [Candidatus Obscuribacterales bacterium]